MFVIWPILAILGLGFFLIGTVVGSFLNVCIYRIPWQKSVIWPGSRCPVCFVGDRCARQHPDRELDRLAGRVPRVVVLRSRCATPWWKPWSACCSWGPFFVDVIAGPRGAWGQVPAFQLVAAAYHAVFLALLVAATFIDYDLMMIPDQITVTGMVVGVALGTLWPQVRPGPAAAMTIFRGSGSALLGLLVGVGLDSVRPQDAPAFVFRREAMGFGDVTLMGMIGAFLGWQAAVLTFFLGPFFGLGHAAWKLLRYLKKKCSPAANYPAPIAKFLMGLT